MLQLYIGNKNYSSWSMRAGVLLHEFGIPHEEVKLRLNFDEGSAFKERIATVTPTGRVPVLVDDGFAVWDTLAIAEYLHDKFPALGLWPLDVKQRARARSLVAEMHSGFTALRSHCPMNLEASLPEVGARLLREQPQIGADVRRIEAMWTEQLRASGGPFLFGAYSIADAFYAPVTTRLRTYGLPVGDAASGYIETIRATASFKAWLADALAEADFLDFDEPYRTGR